MNIFTYRSGQVNQSQIYKSGLDQPSYRIDFTDGIASSSISISAVTVGAVNSANADVTASVISAATTSGAVVTVSMLTAGTSGTQTAIDGAEFRMRTTATLSDSRVLIYDTFLIVDNPTYDPAA